MVLLQKIYILQWFLFKTGWAFGKKNVPFSWTVNVLF